MAQPNDPKVKCGVCNFPNDWPIPGTSQAAALFSSVTMDCSNCGNTLRMQPVIDFPWVGVPVTTPPPPHPTNSSNRIV